MESVTWKAGEIPHAGGQYAVSELIDYDELFTILVSDIVSDEWNGFNEFQCFVSMQYM